MNKWRRYVYLVVDNLSGTYPLRRIDASSLFFSRNQVKVTLPPEETPLPRPHLDFTPSRNKYKGSLEFFGFFGLGHNKSLLAAVDYKGVSHTYNVQNRAIHDIASPNESKHCDPVSLAIGEALYVMDREPVPGSRCGFEALTFDPPKEEVMGKPDWGWHCLKPPPFVLEPGYNRTSIRAYTVVGDSSIWISTPGIGTYSFDTAKASWSKAGDWELPFRGRADFFPQYGVWIGFSSQDNLLCCSSDLRASVQCAPALDMVWDDLNPLGNWILLKSHLVRIGSGKFCVAKLFERVDNEVTRNRGCIPHIDRFSVFTGLELMPSGDGRGLMMIKHKSRIYRFQGTTAAWVF